MARYGGEEFVIVLGSTDVKAAGALAEKVRWEIEALKLLHEYREGGNVVTLSIGVASAIANAGSSPSGLIKAADKSLYKAKEEGRNRVEISNDLKTVIG